MRSMREMLNLFQPTMVALLELRINAEKADHVCKKLKKKNWVRVEVMGFSGSIWILWDDEDVILKVRHTNKKYVNLAVLLTIGVSWELTVVYVSPNR